MSMREDIKENPLFFELFDQEALKRENADLKAKVEQYMGMYERASNRADEEKRANQWLRDVFQYGVNRAELKGGADGWDAAANIFESMPLEAALPIARKNAAELRRKATE